MSTRKETMQHNQGRGPSLLDESFVYTPSAETDLRKTFARIRREQREKLKKDNVQQITDRRKQA